MEQIALYWGAFNPPHILHEEVIKTILSKTIITKIIIVPSWLRSDKTYNISKEYRNNLINLFIKNLSWLNIELNKDFFLDKIPSTTMVWMDEYFKKKLWYSPYQIFWSDVIKDLDKWYEPLKVKKYIPKIFVSREWFDLDNSWLENYLYVKISFDNQKLIKLKHLSSTIIKENIKKWIYTWLNLEIAEYIKEKWLYLEN